jgi:hypothetical protein
MLLRYKGPERNVSPNKVIGRVDPLLTLMEDGKLGHGGGVEQGTRVSNLVGSRRGKQRKGVREESQVRHPYIATGMELGPEGASMLGGDDKVSIGMKAIMALDNTSDLVASWHT